MSIEEAIRKYINLANDERSRRIMMKKTHPSIAEPTSFEAEYRQIANWLQELKERREKESRIEIGDIAPVVEQTPSESIEAMRKLAERMPEIVEGIQEAMKKLVEAFTSETIWEYIQRKEESK